MSSILDQYIMYLPGVGPKKKEILSKELGICSYGDLLEYYPYKYVDRTKVFHISELTPEMPFSKGTTRNPATFCRGAEVVPEAAVATIQLPQKSVMITRRCLLFKLK